MSKKSILKYGASMLLSAGLLLNLGSLEVLATEKDKEDPNYFAPQDDVLSRRSIFFEQATLGTMRTSTVPTFQVDGSTQHNTQQINGYVFEKFNKTTGNRENFLVGEVVAGASGASAGVDIHMSSDAYLVISTDTTATGGVTSGGVPFFRAEGNHDGYHRGQLSVTVEPNYPPNIVLDNLSIYAHNGETDAAGLVIGGAGGDTAQKSSANIYIKGENEIYTSTYVVDFKFNVDVSLYEYVSNVDSSLLLETDGTSANSYGAYVRSGSTLTIESGSVDISSTNRDGANIGAGSHLTINGGETSIVSEESYGVRMLSGATVTVNGGNLYAEGILGVSRSGTTNNKFIMNGGYAKVVSRTGVAINTAGDNGLLGLYGGQLELESEAADNVYTDNIDVTGGGGRTFGKAVLIKSGNIQSLKLNEGIVNLLVIDKSENQTDPIGSLYSNSTAIVDEESTEPVYYGRVYGNVVLEQDFVIEDSWVVDIPPGNTLRHVDASNSNYKNLAIAPGGTLRFQGVSEDTSEAKCPYLWNNANLHKGVYDETTGATYYGRMLYLIHEDIIFDNEYDGMEYSETSGSSPQFGSSFVEDGGRGTLWGGVSVSYTQYGESLKATTNVLAGDFTVTAKYTADRYLNTTASTNGFTSIHSSVVGRDMITSPWLESVGSAVKTFNIKPYDISNDRIDKDTGNPFAVTITDEGIEKEDADNASGISSETIEVSFELDAAGGLEAADAAAFFKITSPFSGSDPLVYGTDYQISTTKVNQTDASATFQIQVTGLGNYSGVYVDDTVYSATVVAGSLGGKDVSISGTGEVYVKPDGTIDLTQVEITDVESGDPIEFYSADYKVTETPEGNLLYSVEIAVVEDGGSHHADTLDFTVTALTAGSGKTFAKGQLNLVVPMYERPDCKLYAEDLYLTDKDGELTYKEHYELYYWDADKSVFVDFDRWVDCEDADLKEPYTAQSGTNKITVKAVKIENGAASSKAEDAVEFNVIWEKGGSVTSTDFASGALSEYREGSAINNTLYVAKDFGVVLSAEDMGIAITTLVEVPDGEDVNLVPANEPLSDGDIAYVQSYDEFEAYVKAVNSEDAATYSGKSQLVSSINLTRKGEPYTEGTKKDLVDGTEKKWYLTLQGTGNYKGYQFFEVPADSIVFLDLADGVDGVLGDYLLMELNNEERDVVYQKPDGTLHTQDIQLYQRLTTLIDAPSGKDTTEQLINTTYYTITVPDDSTTGTWDKTGAGQLIYAIELRDASGGKVKSLQAGNVGEDFDTHDFYVEAAGSGDTYRHGKIDLVKDSYKIDYVAPSEVTDEDGDENPEYNYSTEDREKIIKQIPLYSNGTLLKYGEDYTATLTVSTGHLVTDLIYTLTVTGLANTKSSDTSSVTFDVELEMNYGTLSFDKNGGNNLNSTTFAPMIVESTTDTLTLPTGTGNTVPTKEGYTFVGWALDEDGTVPVPNTGATIIDLVTLAATNNIAVTDNKFTFYAVWEKDAEKYAVIFHGNGAVLDNTTYKNLELVEGTDFDFEIPVDPKRTSYKFDGWTVNKVPVAGETFYQGGDTFTIQEGTFSESNELTLYAQWTAVYSVSFDGNGVTLGDSDYQSELTADESFTLPTTNPSREGFQFAGWFLSDGTKVDENDLSIATLITHDRTTHNFTIFAKWTAVYSVTFDENKGTFPSDVTGLTQTKLEGTATVNLPSANPARTGYTFAGWATSSKGAVAMTSATNFDVLLNMVNADSNATMVNRAITLYAVWLPNHYTVTFDPTEGGFETESDKTQTSTNYVDLVDFSKEPTRDGYYFKGWSTTQNDTSDITPGTKTSFYDLATTEGTDNLDGSKSYTGTLYAVWEKMIDYGIYFDYNFEGKGLISSLTDYSADTTTDATKITFPSALTRTGYTFVGWYIVEDGVEIPLTHTGDSASTYGDLTFDHTVKGSEGNDITVEIIYAKWSENEYGLIFDLGGGHISNNTANVTETATWLETISFPANPEKDRHEFDGWFYGDTRLEDGISISQVISSDNVPSETTITAKWKEIPLADITLIFRWETEGGSLSESQVVKENATFLFPTTPTWEGFNFVGWHLNDTTEIKSNDMEALLAQCTAGTEEIVLTGKWVEVEKTYKVVLYKNDGTSTVVDTLTSSKSTDKVILPSPTREGYKFLGWTKTNGTNDTDYVKSDAKTYGELTSSTSAVLFEGTLYAQWDKTEINTPVVTYTVTFDHQDGKTANKVVSDTSGSESVSFPSTPSNWSDNTYNYTFKGWYTEATGGSAKTSGTFQDLTTVDSTDSTKASGTLYAQWNKTLIETSTPEDKVSYSVTFDYNYSGANPSLQSSENGGDPVNFTKPTRTGYTFLGWTKSNSSSDTTYYASGDFESLTTKGSNGNYTATFYAQWKINEGSSGGTTPSTTYVVNFYQNYGTAGILSSKSSTSGSANVVFPSNPTRSGYTFDGWTTTSSGGTKVTSGTFAQLTTAASTNYYTGDLYAQWTYNGGSSGGTDSDSGNNNSGGSSSGGSSSGGSSSGNSNAGSTVPDVNVNNDVAGDRVTVDLLLKPSVSGTQLNTTVTGDAMNDALSQAGSNKDYDVTITPDYSGSTAGKDYDFTLDRGALEAFADSSAATLTVIRDDVVITFDRAAVDHILYNTLNAVIVSVDNKNLSSAASAAFGNRPSYDVSITDSIGTSLSNLGDGVMKVTLPFTANATELAGNLIAGRVNYYGDVEYQVKSYYNGEGMLILSDKLGVYGITLRDNSSVITNLDSHWSEEFARFTDARRLYAEINSVDLNDQITRADFVTIVGIIAGIDVSKQSNPDFFQDVSPSAYYAPYVQWAFENNVSAGKLDGYFDPDAEINREEMATMLLAYVRSMDKELEVINGQKKFTDEDVISKWAEDAVQYVQTLGLIYGKDDDYFDPKGLTTFGDHAVMMMRLIESIVNIHTVYLGE